MTKKSATPKVSLEDIDIRLGEGLLRRITSTLY